MHCASRRYPPASPLAGRTQPLEQLQQLLVCTAWRLLGGGCNGRGGHTGADRRRPRRLPALLVLVFVVFVARHPRCHRLPRRWPHRVAAFSRRLGTGAARPAAERVPPRPRPPHPLRSRRHPRPPPVRRLWPPPPRPRGWRRPRPPAVVGLIRRSPWPRRSPSLCAPARSRALLDGVGAIAASTTPAARLPSAQLEAWAFMCARTSGRSTPHARARLLVQRLLGRSGHQKTKEMPAFWKWRPRCAGPRQQVGLVQRDAPLRSVQLTHVLEIGAAEEKRLRASTIWTMRRARSSTPQLRRPRGSSRRASGYCHLLQSAISSPVEKRHTLVLLELLRRRHRATAAVEVWATRCPLERARAHPPAAPRSRR